MTGATGRNADFHGERRTEHVPVTRKAVNATVILALLLFCVACWYVVGYALVTLGGAR